MRSPARQDRPPGEERDLAAFAARAAALWSGTRPESPRLVQLAGDGSTRRVYRVLHAGLTAVAVAHPLPVGRAHPDENEGFLAVRAFLEQRGVRVPRLYAADLERGYLLLEDLGDERLYERARRSGWEARDGEVEHLYEEAIRMLVRIQAPGEPWFRTEWTSNPPYAEEFVVEMEARYFHTELVRAMTARTEAFGEIEGECRLLARAALGGSTAAFGAAGDGAPGDATATHSPTPAHFTFMHRDYQSRNLMIAGGALAVIDFQGARWGPPEYDLAALLFDPYTAMPEGPRARLVSLYRREAARAGVRGVSAEERGAAGRAGGDAWRERFLANAADRLMQALGAYGKLGGRMKRPGFLEHIPQALLGLDEILAALDRTPRLHALVRELRAHAWPARPS